ncbi:MAG: ATPase [Lachnospiraceae bacterium]|nr:ATPase [Lachnospiraceae bacterium]
MSMLVKVLLVVALLLSIVVPFGAYLLGERSRKRYKKSLAFNVFMFFGTFVLASVIMLATPVAAAEVTETMSIGKGLAYIAAALAVSLSGIGGGIAVASAASAALGAISEDSSLLGKSLIFVGLAEGIALYGLIISFMILGKL